MNMRKSPWRHVCPTSIDTDYPELKDPKHLATLHTRQLLGLLRSEAGQLHPKVNSELKKILSTREHIPNTKQAKELRRQKAKFQKTR